MIVQKITDSQTYVHTCRSKTVAFLFEVVRHKVKRFTKNVLQIVFPKIHTIKEVSKLNSY